MSVPFHPFQLDRRLRVVRWLVWGTFSVLLIAFFRTQILGHGAFQLQSEHNRLKPITLPAPRGLLLDRNGKIIAENIPGYTISLLPDDTTKLRATLRKIAPIVHLDSGDVDRVLQRYARAPYQPVLVMAGAPLDMVAALEERRLEIPGLFIQTEPRRYYPDSGVAAHLVGNVGEITEDELASKRYAGLRPGALVGKTGLEREYDDSLRGQDGLRFVEVSAMGHVVREAGAAPTLQPVAGSPIRTTIDLDLQRYVSRIFPKGQRGAVIAMNPNTGEILALYSAPGFDPNAFVGGVDPGYMRSLTENPANPFFDRAIQARYPPGSTWKLLVAAIALRRGVVTMNSRMPMPCRGGMQFGDRFFRCWEPTGHGDLTLKQAIGVSCDVYFYQLGLKLGLTSLLEDVNALGFHSRTGIDLPGEIASEFPSGTDYFDRLYGSRHWSQGVTLNLAIGQGENDQTLVDMMRLYQMLASDGKSRTPYVVHPSVQPETDLGLTPEQLEGLRQAMIGVVETGTARLARLGNVTIAGKTGTAQNSHGPNHGWFIAFAPAEQPQIVVGAIVEFAREGPYVAPLVTRAIAKYLGIDSTIVSNARLVLPTDSAPREIRALPATRDTLPPPDTLTTHAHPRPR
ncbi:MAG TPA: penicillin-binding protein 2 [Gemmatimonadales bacterium]